MSPTVPPSWVKVRLGDEGGEDGTDLDDADVRFLAGFVDGDFGDALNPVLDGVGDMRDDLGRRINKAGCSMLTNAPGRSCRGSRPCAVGLNVVEDGTRRAKGNSTMVRGRRCEKG